MMTTRKNLKRFGLVGLLLLGLVILSAGCSVNITVKGDHNQIHFTQDIRMSVSDDVLKPSYDKFLSKSKP